MLHKLFHFNKNEEDKNDDLKNNYELQKEFLHHVLFGEEDQAEAILKKLQKKYNSKDIANFKAMSFCFEYINTL